MTLEMVRVTTAAVPNRFDGGRSRPFLAWSGVAVMCGLRSQRGMATTCHAALRPQSAHHCNA